MLSVSHVRWTHVVAPPLLLFFWVHLGFQGGGGHVHSTACSWWQGGPLFMSAVGSCGVSCGEFPSPQMCTSLQSNTNSLPVRFCGTHAHLNEYSNLAILLHEIDHMLSLLFLMCLRKNEHCSCSFMHVYMYVCCDGMYVCFDGMYESCDGMYACCDGMYVFLL